MRQIPPFNDTNFGKWEGKELRKTQKEENDRWCLAPYSDFALSKTAIHWRGAETLSRIQIGPSTWSLQVEELLALQHGNLMLPLVSPPQQE